MTDNPNKPLTKAEREVLLASIRMTLRDRPCILLVPLQHEGVDIVSNLPTIQAVVVCLIETVAQMTMGKIIGTGEIDPKKEDIDTN